jgi:prefoldin subunit 5
MFRQLTPAHRTFAATSTEDLGDLLYEIGKDLAAKKQHELAVHWLERACDILSEQDVDALSENAIELKLSILHDLVKSLLAINTAESKKKALDMIELMDTV